ncbi:MAG: transposase [Euryarchaeota archaeon]|nr:transposase [Euryarchaeota archaeon]
MNNKSSLNRRLSLANFRRIQNFVEYKARWHGIRVSYVDPAYTSSVCPFCNSNLSLPSDGENKDLMGGRALYCPSCGKYYHRDFIATLNLFKKYKEKKQKMCGIRVHHKSPMKTTRTGAVLPNGVWHRGKLTMTMSPGYA